MKTIKRLTCVLLALVMLMGILFVSVPAAAADVEEETSQSQRVSEKPEDDEASFNEEDTPDDNEPTLHSDEEELLGGNASSEDNDTAAVETVEDVVFTSIEEPLQAGDEALAKGKRVRQQQSNGMVEKSADLARFLATMKIYENEEVKLSTEDDSAEDISFYLGREYQYEFAFAEQSSGGQYLEMEPNDDGCLTFSLPAQIAVEDDESGHPITIDNGKAVGEFTVQDGTVTVQFYDVDENGDPSDQSWLDSNGLKKISITLRGKFRADGGDQTTVTIAGSKQIKISLLDDASLHVVKKAVDYDESSHTLFYEITVQATSGTVTGLSMTDTVTSHNSRILTDTITANIGDKEQAAPTCTAVGDDTYQISGLPDLQEGEVLTVTYRSKLEDDRLLLQGGTNWMTVNNEVAVTGTGLNGKTLMGQDTGTRDVAVTNLLKQGEQTTVLNRDGQMVPVIQWIVQVGDGSFSVDGVTVTDILGPGLTLYTEQPLSITAIDENKQETVLQWDWNDSGVETGKTETVDGEERPAFDVTLPTSTGSPYCKFQIKYYTEYEVKDTTAEYHNTVTARIRDKSLEYGTTSKVIPVGVVQLKKDGQRNGDKLEWTVTMSLPGALYGTETFYLEDVLDGYAPLGEDGAWRWYGANQTMDDLQIVVTPTGEEPILFTQYQSGGDTENTYTLHNWNGNRMHILFNCSGGEYRDSKWLLDKDATVTLTYSTPTTNILTHWVNGTQYPTGTTIADVLHSGGKMVNEASLFYSGKSQATVEKQLDGLRLIKEGKQVDTDGLIQYTVTLHNWNSAEQTVVLSGEQMKSLMFQDDFDSRMEYVPDTLQLSLCETNRREAQRTYRYSGTATGNRLEVAAQSFVDNDTTLADNTDDWKGDLVFTYQLRVKEDDRNAIAAQLELDNVAAISWGDSEHQRVTAADTVSYHTGILDKTIVNAPEEGSTLTDRQNVLTYQITLNPNELDLVTGGGSVTILDKLPDCLNLFWDTVTVEAWENGRWTTLDSTQWQKSFYQEEETAQKILSVQVPDEQFLRLTYDCSVVQYGANVEIVNEVEVVGCADVKTTAESVFYVEHKQGSASAENGRFSLVKTDGTTHSPMEGVSFALYSTENRTDRTAPDGIPAAIDGKNGATYYYHSDFVTDTNGSFQIQDVRNDNRYVLREVIAPTGYEIMDDCYIWYTKERMSDDGEDLFVNVVEDQILAVVNVPIVPVTVQLQAAKTMNGGEPFQDEIFTFQVLNNDNEIVCKTENSGSTVSFPEMAFDTAGTYYYSMIEKPSDEEDGILYDDTVYQAAIIVTQREGAAIGEPKLQAAVTYSKDGTALAEGDVPLFANETKNTDDPGEPSGITEDDDPDDDPQKPEPPENRENLPTVPDEPTPLDEVETPMIPQDDPDVPITEPEEIAEPEEPTEIEEPTILAEMEPTDPDEPTTIDTLLPTEDIPQIEVPDEPESPTYLAQVTKTVETPGTPQTGDTTTAALWGATAVASLTALASIGGILYIIATGKSTLKEAVKYRPRRKK